MEEKEIENLINKYGRDVYNFCFFISGDADLADELYQDTFLTVIYKQKKIEKENNIKSYIMGIAVNLWKNHQKKMNRRNCIAPCDCVEDYESICNNFSDLSSEVAKNEELKCLRQAVNTLPEKLRVPVILHYAGDMTTDNIGKSLGIPKGTVLSRLHKARELIRKEMEKYGY